MKRPCLIALVLLSAGTLGVAQNPFEIRSYDAANEEESEWTDVGLEAGSFTDIELRFLNSDSSYFTLLFVHTSIPQQFSGRTTEMQTAAEAMLDTYPYFAAVTGVTGAALEVNGWKVDDTSRALKVPSALVISAVSAFLSESPYAPTTHGIDYSHASNPLVVDIPEASWGEAPATSARRPWVDASAGGSATRIPIEQLGQSAITRQGREANGDEEFTYLALGDILKCDIGYEHWIQAIQIPKAEPPSTSKPIKIRMPIFVRRYPLTTVDPPMAAAFALWGPERKLPIWATPSVRAYYGIADGSPYSVRQELIVDFPASVSGPLKALVVTASGPVFIDSVTGFFGNGVGYLPPVEGVPPAVSHVVFNLPAGAVPGTVWFFDAVTWAVREPLYGIGSAGSQGAVVLPVAPPPPPPQ